MTWAIAVAALIVAIAGVSSVVYVRSKRKAVPVASDTVEAIRSALANHNDLELEYYSSHRERVVQRTVTPLTLSDDMAYLRAYDRGRHRERTFKVAQIEAIAEVPRGEGASES